MVSFVLEMSSDIFDFLKPQRGGDREAETLYSGKRL
jgi:hypothetical protein